MLPFEEVWKFHLFFSFKFCYTVFKHSYNMCSECVRIKLFQKKKRTKNKTNADNTLNFKKNIEKKQKRRKKTILQIWNIFILHSPGGQLIYTFKYHKYMYITVIFTGMLLPLQGWTGTSENQNMYYMKMRLAVSDNLTMSL